MNTLKNKTHKTQSFKLSLATGVTIFFAAIGGVNMFIGLLLSSITVNPPVELGYMVLAGLVCLFISFVSASFEN